VKHTPFDRRNLRTGGYFIFREDDNRMQIKEDPLFQSIYGRWLDVHQKTRTGERKRRLSQGVGHAEKMFLQSVWFPAFGHFDGLAPEYEVRDFKDGSRFVDFAYIAGNLRLAVEIDGFGPHWRDADRWQFADHLMRQNHLMIDGWKVLRFSYDDISEKPRRCQQLLQQAFGKWRLAGDSDGDDLTPMELAILQWADTSSGPLMPIKAAQALSVHRKTAAKHFRALVDKGFLSPLLAESQRVMRYALNRRV
jgi:hypothetical protein